jgi:hypothetical protein
MMMGGMEKQVIAAVLYFFCMVFLLACNVGTGSLNARAGEADDDGACQPCEFLGGEGLCLDRSLPPVAAALADPTTGPALEAGAEACALANEVCVPCVNPLTGENTGACELGPVVCSGGGLGTCDNPVEIVDPATFPACEVGGRCVDKAIVAAQSPASVDRLPPCTETANGVCVPEDAVRYGGNYKPTSCETVGLEGRCLPEFVIPEEQKDKLDSLPNDPICEDSELCAPCYDPLTGEDTGACSSTACDAPAGGQSTFASCVQNRGKCIPDTVIAAQGKDTDNLAQRDCPAESYCVPNRLVAQPPVYQLCNGNKGTCLDVTVLDVPLSGTFSQSTCPAVERCVPCQGPFGGATGAPGCP